MIDLLRKDDGTYIVMNGHGCELPEPFLAEKISYVVKARCMETPFRIETSQGVFTGNAGDYLITGIDGELYPVPANLFHAYYDPIPDEEAHHYTACSDT